MTAPATIDTTDPLWSASSPAWSEPYLCAATPIELDTARRPRESEVRLLHAMITSALGRGHPPGGQRWSHQRPDWSLVEAGAPSGWAVVWWAARDGEAMSRSVHRVRLGRAPCTMVFGPVMRIKAPPAYVKGPHHVRIRAVTPVCSHTWIKDENGKRIAPMWRTSCTSAHIEGALSSLAAKLCITGHDPLRVAVVSAQTQAVERKLGGKLGIRRGWRGDVDLVCNAPARWLIDVACRGLGLGGSTAYGLGRVVRR